MMGWWVAGIVCVLALGLFLRMRERHQRQLEDRANVHANRMIEVKTEAEKRVNRIERATSLDKARAHHKLVVELLPALDALEEASRYANDLGLDLIVKRFDDALASHGVTRIAPEEGDAFNPKIHEAIEKSSSELPLNSITKTHRVGWRDDLTVLRPAMVSVSAGTPEPEIAGNSTNREVRQQE